MLIIIIGAVWWFVASQSNSQNEPNGTIDQTQVPSSQDQTQNQSTPATANQPGGQNSQTTPSSLTPSGNLSTGNTNDDISKDLTNVDSLLNSLYSDITNSNQTVTPVTVQ